MKKYATLFATFIVLAAVLRAACPCITLFCPCCIDSCRIGFAKFRKDGCRNQSGRIQSTVVMQVGPTGTKLSTYQGLLDYTTVSNLFGIDSDSINPGSMAGMAQTTKSIFALDGQYANLNAILDGTYAKHNTLAGIQTPKLFMAAVGYTDASGTAGAILSRTAAIDLFTGNYTLGNAEGPSSPTWVYFLKPDGDFATPGLGNIPLLSPTGNANRFDFKSAYLAMINGRRGPTDYYDIGVQIYNSDLYSWRACTDCFGCGDLFVWAVVMPTVLPNLMSFGATFAITLSLNTALLALTSQALGFYCTLFACNKQCTYGTISAVTDWYVLFEPATGGARDLVLNDVNLGSKLDMVQGPAGTLLLGPGHYVGPLTNASGDPVAKVIIGTILDLGKSDLNPNDMESSRETPVMLVPPASPADVPPGGVFAIERRN